MNFKKLNHREHRDHRGNLRTVRAVRFTKRENNLLFVSPSLCVSISCKNLKTQRHEDTKNEIFDNSRSSQISSVISVVNLYMQQG